uniref:Hydroxyethylthiazole kinase n=1 Tax=Loigolactobacillus rennini TaxID=238013 RepID=A0A1K2I668_9LACO|nr:Hydroxyethylthiazole kinase [Loigolactobacillus rennini]
MLKQYRTRLNEKHPLIHCITNYVTVNDVANILLASGASPVMADEPKEVAEITAASAGLTLNLGTLNQISLTAMLVAGKKANQLGHPIVFDPVALGASTLRTQATKQILQQLQLTVIRGNSSEIRALINGAGQVKGVDAVPTDQVTPQNRSQFVTAAKRFCRQHQVILVITGETDLIVSANRVATINNGTAMMANITGAGCMLTALLTAYMAVAQDNGFMAAVAAVCHMGLAGQKAEQKRLHYSVGNVSFRNYLIDAIGQLNGANLDQEAIYEIDEN